MPPATAVAELRRLDLQLTGLVYARAVREREGATGEELRRYSEEIDRQRRRLAERGAKVAA
jgi:hypothetical protein